MTAMVQRHFDPLPDHPDNDPAEHLTYLLLQLRRIVAGSWICTQCGCLGAPEETTCIHCRRVAPDPPRPTPKALTPTNPDTNQRVVTHQPRHRPTACG